MKYLFRGGTVVSGRGTRRADVLVEDDGPGFDLARAEALFAPFVRGETSRSRETGGTGLGKTFLSASIARVVSASGHSVVYDTAGHIFARFEAKKFGRDDGENADTAVSRALGCDLLILDDLGTELMTSFVHSAMYQIVNTRLITGKKTVISTNLSPDELGRRYGAPVLSRLQGEYQILLFFGEDIRKLRRRQQM